MDVTWSMWWTIGVIAAAIVVALIAVDIWLVMRSRSRRRERDFGRVRGDTTAERGSNGHRAAALQEDPEIAARRARVQSYGLRGLSDEERVRYGERWRLIQGEFVANPRDAVSRADELVVAVMMARGYPGSSDPELRAADLSVTHAGASESYRWAHHVLTLSDTPSVRDEDLRNAMMQYERVFNTLVPSAERTETGRAAPRRGVAMDI